MELITNSLEDLDGVVEQIIDYAGDRKVWLFFGEIGAGKTTLIQRLCSAYGVEEKVTSPTFSLVNQYDGSQGAIFHLDLYRLDDMEEAIDIGIEDILYEGQLALIEWPQVIEPLLPEDVLEIRIEITGNSNRRISLK